jgi:hypothetical protein
MPAWLDRLMRRAPASPLAQQLRSYPPYVAPHGGPPQRWTAREAKENLEHLLQHREERLRVLGELLAHYRIDSAPALAGSPEGPLLEALHRWAGEHWPLLHDPQLATRERWMQSSRTGAETVYSLLLDVSLLLGEVIVRRHPRFHWGVDLDEENLRDGMVSAKRPVLLLDDVPGQPPVVIDVEDIVVSRYQQPEAPGHRWANPWTRLVHDVVSGAYDPPGAKR